METIEVCNKGLPIFLDINTQEIVYKDNRVLFRVIKMVYESGRDKVQLSKDIIYRKSCGLVEFGCLTLTEEKVQQLIKKVCKQLK